MLKVDGLNTQYREVKRPRSSYTISPLSLNNRVIETIFLYIGPDVGQKSELRVHVTQLNPSYSYSHLQLNTVEKVIDFLKIMGRFVTDLNLRHYQYEMNNQYLSQIVALCPNLEILDLTGCRRLQDVRVIANCEQLRELYLTACSRITDVSCLKKCEKLKKVDLGSCTQLRRIAPLSSHLSELNLCYCQNIEDVEKLYAYPNVMIRRFIYPIMEREVSDDNSDKSEDDPNHLIDFILKNLPKGVNRSTMLQIFKNSRKRMKRDDSD